MPLAILSGAVAVVAAAWAVFSGKAKLLAVAGVALLIGAGAFAAERAIVTEAEKVEALLLDLADAAVAGDVETVLAALSPKADVSQSLVRMGLMLIEIDDDLRISDRQTEVTANATQARTRFRANGTVRMQKMGSASSRIATLWELIWRKEAGDWKIVEIRRLNPITEQPIDLLSAR